MNAPMCLAMIMAVQGVRAGGAVAQTRPDHPAAQAPPPAAASLAPTPQPASDSSWQAFVTIDANNSGWGTWLQVTPSAGYTFDRHWSVEAGFPVYYVNASSTDTGTVLTGVGDLYASVSLDLSSETTAFYATLTGTAPTGDVLQGLGAGGASWDVTGHLSGSVGRVTPYVNAGVGNNIALTDAAAFQGRPSSSAGGLFHLEGGVEVEIWRSTTLSGSAYTIRPVGTQTVTRPVVRPRPGPQRPNRPNPRPGGGPGGAGPVPVVIDLADLVRDNGFEIVASGSLTRYLDLSLWFSRSHTFEYNTYSISLGVNLIDLLRKPNATMVPLRSHGASGAPEKE